MRKYPLILLTFVVISRLSFFGQARTAGNQQTPTIRTTAREVILDVVVRDKHHHAVANIRPDEIEVYENGVKQKIDGFRSVQGAEELKTEEEQAKKGSSASAPKTSENGATTLHELNFVSIVFAQIAPLDLDFARRAVLEFLKSDTLPNTYVTIYRLDRSLQVIQPYTADKKTLISAVNNAATGLSRGGSSLPNNVASAINNSIDANAENILAGAPTSQSVAQAVENSVINPGPQIVADPFWARNAAAEDASITVGNALVTQAMIVRGLRFADNLSNGMDAMDALRQLIRIQSNLPGRKVVLYLADGLTLPMDRRDVVNSVLSYANQREVSFYTVDTRGLSLEDPMTPSLANQRTAAAESSVNRVSPRMGHMEDDDIQLANSSNQQLAMQELAESTGGFAVANTNQIALPMQHVMEDIRTHYEIAYTPSDRSYDGRFRRIEVRIDRPQVTVQTRSGYFAVPDINGEPVQPVEMTALRAMNTSPLPVNFPYETSLLRFRPNSSGVECEMAFDVPIAGLHVLVDPRTGDGQIRLSLLALIHRSDGTIVGKVSRELARDIPKSELSKLGGQDILYIEPVKLPGGHYVVETAVTDELTQKTTVKRLSIFVNSQNDFSVSSLQLVKSVQPLPAVRNSQDPYETESGRVVPTLSDSMPAGKPIGVYFVVYPLTGSEVPPTVILHLYRDGQEIGQKTLGPLHAQADGSIPMLLQINPDPGECDMVVTAQQGNLRSEARLSVKIDPPANASVN